MATLTMQDATGPQQVLQNRPANVEVTVALSVGAVWGDYDAPGAGEGFFLYGPDHHPAGLALSGLSSTLESKTFTPKIAGRYLVICVVTETGGDQVTLSGLFEVASAYGEEALPAPREGGQYTANTGWSRSIEQHLRRLQKILGGRMAVMALNGTGGDVSAGDMVKVTDYVRFSGAGADGDAMADHLTDVAVSTGTANATQETIADASLGVWMEPVLNGASGMLMLRGYYPVDTSAWTAENDPVYISDTGDMAKDAGSKTRKVGYCVKKAASTMVTSPAGLVWFDGTPAATANGVPVDTLNNGSIDTVSEFNSAMASAGRLAGFTISDNGDGSIAITAGNITLRAVDDPMSTLYTADIGAVDPLALSDTEWNWVYVEYNGGTPQVVATTTARTDFNTNVLVCMVWRDGTDLHINHYRRLDVGDGLGLLQRRLLELNVFDHVSGAALGEPVDLQLSVGAGIWWDARSRFTTAAFDSSVADTWNAYYRDGGGGWTEQAGQDTISNTLYDDGSGVLATLDNKKYGVHWIYLEQDGDLAVLYGQDEYSAKYAEATTPPSAVPSHLAEGHAKLIGRAIVKMDATSFDSLQTTLGATFSGGVDVIEHDDTGGLQGGQAGEHYHLTAAEHAALGGGGADGMGVGDWAYTGAAPVLAEWEDASLHRKAENDGDGPLATRDTVSVNGTMIRMVMTDATTQAQGLVHTNNTPAGDFVYAARLGVQFPVGMNPNTVTDFEAYFVFFDGTTDVDIDKWQGSGLLGISDTQETWELGPSVGTSVTAYWNSTAPGGFTNIADWRGGTYDIFLQRSGTDLHIFYAIAGQMPSFMYTYTVSANAGKLGVRLSMGDAGEIPRVFLMAFKSLAAVPGY